VVVIHVSPSFSYATTYVRYALEAMCTPWAIWAAQQLHGFVTRLAVLLCGLHFMSVPQAVSHEIAPPAMQWQCIMIVKILAVDSHGRAF
jgi:hypothetical protein